MTERAEFGHCTYCCNDFKIGVKTYRIGDVIGADTFDHNTPTIGIYRLMADKPGGSNLLSLIFFGILGESVKLGKMPFWGFQRQKW